MKPSVVGIIIAAIVAFALALAIGLGVGLANRCKPVGRENVRLIPPPSHDSNMKDDVTDDDVTDDDVTDAPTMSPKVEVDESMDSVSEKYKYMATETDTDRCSEVAADILVAKQGTAVDAAIAGVFCIGTVNPVGSGVGGGHFMTVYQAPKGSTQKKMVALLSRETLPSAADRDFYIGGTRSTVVGGTAVGVPGEVMGLYTAWQMFGKVTWAELVAPALTLAEEGFPVEGDFVAAVKAEMKALNDDELLRKHFLKADGSSYNKGDILKRPEYAKTLRIIAEDPMSFYNGSLADDIVADLQERGGVISKEDLLKYETRVKEPIIGRLPTLNLTMYSPPPPSSGIIVQLILRLIDGLMFKKDSIKDTPAAIESYHKLIEAWKFAFAKRSALGDVDFVNIEQLLTNLTDSTYISDIRKQIDPTRTYNDSFYKPAFEDVSDSGTSHSNYYDSDGNAVAVTTTINLRFGSKVVGKRTGIVFNNEMDDFSVPGTVNSFGYPASPTNYPEPGKSPMSSMSPTIMLTDDGQVAYSTGAVGGSRIITEITYVALHNLYLNLNLKEATDLPRLHHQLLPRELFAEKGFKKDVLDGLKAKGHVVADLPFRPCGTIRNYCATCTADNSCMQEKRCVHAVADNRKSSASTGGY